MTTLKNSILNTTRNIFEEEEEEEEKEKEKEEEKKENKNEEILLIKKRKSKRKVIESEICDKNNGIEMIYLKFFSICQFHKGNEAYDLKNLINTYREWCFQLYPNIAFEDVIDKINTFNSKSCVAHTIEKLRNQECNRYMKDVLGVAPYFKNFDDDDEDDIEVKNKDKNINNSSPQRSTTPEDFSPVKQSLESQNNPNKKRIVEQLPEEFNWLSSYNEEEWISIDEIPKKSKLTSITTTSPKELEHEQQEKKIVEEEKIQSLQGEELEEININEKNDNNDDNNDNNDSSSKEEKKEEISDEWNEM